MELLSRESGLEPSCLEKWRNAALAGMVRGLNTRNGDPSQSELDQARKRLEELTKENELLKAMVKKQGPKVGDKKSPKKVKRSHVEKRTP